MAHPPEFKAFPKTPRLFRDIVVTEKLDGTNACIVIQHDEELGAWAVWPQSRKRFLNVREDNFGFAAWALEHREELIELGPGYHYGEWWGQGIQRGYDLDEKRFSLFGHWYEDIPECVSTVPVLYQGQFSGPWISETLSDLRQDGSVAAPGYMNPEGIVIYHEQSRQRFKVTLNDDYTGKEER